ncbi:endonuclease/exonuclease/phosphatase family protein [Pseudoalteromonas rubra]|uniref:Endonuclease/exonuclease/phosphatase family protein n=1 Tax=Pseudoalteromonas rubra TaxID=43658 RepID=A0A5S3WMH4_9GAMM|nr:endonuclease/exonuclease/phosphatase family protein [Pseudoalteromonas rubra]TMP28185.1 endonuclease/exonuclease/phosphatase family protein [Pseudoalteromonas rubra]TMP34887.1 endonuclease/exonuclease/phosphatase family protein [Pseudoalteromonas rubra]
MKPIFLPLVLAATVLNTGCQSTSTTLSSDSQPTSQQTLRVATFNVSMEATNYDMSNQQSLSGNALTFALKSGEYEQINNIAQIIQRTRPDIILLNEFDYIEDPEQGINLFKRDYLEVSQNGFDPIDYPYVYLAPVNTGVKTPFSGDDTRLTHYGFGKYPGQYAMVLLSRYPIKQDQIRTFQHFLWKDMPNNLMPTQADGSSWYSAQEVSAMRLSSKSHWDIPVQICNKQLNVLASHPTPPVFDGPEDRNGKRNHDELRLWKDYISASGNDYIYDDKRQAGGFADESFVILGDLNASSVDGDAYPGAIDQLLTHPRVNAYPAPTSQGGQLNKPDNPHSATHTAHWGMRADYVLPSADLAVSGSGVFWPASDEVGAELVADRASSSDHRLVWVDIVLPALECESHL